MKQIEVEINNPTDLKHKMKCPECEQDLEAPNYKCLKCKLKLLFFVKKWQIKV